MFFTKKAQSLAVLFVLAALPAGAQQTSTNRVATNTAWSTFVDGKPKQCWVVAAPTQSENTRGGKAVSVSRGEIRLFVTYRQGTKGEVSFAGGYPFAPSSTVVLDVGGAKFSLYPDSSAKDWAWSGSADDDAKIVAALKGGSNATLTAKSAKGTQTVDTFSLSGFSAAVDEAAKQCAN